MVAVDAAPFGIALARRAALVARGSAPQPLGIVGLQRTAARRAAVKGEDALWMADATKVRRQSAAGWMRARWLVAESIEMLVVPAPVLEVKRSHIGKLPTSS